jgi:hypothetical protein|nr:MAG TPA: hypothetical protein [Caudoviricetes sp.]
MKKIIIKIAIIAVAILALVLAFHKIHKLKEENARLLSNQEILLTQKQTIMAESQAYRVSDSLNAAKVSELQFTLKEYKKYRAQDLQLIEQLKVKKSDLQKVIDSQTETINSLSAKLNDSIRIDTVTNIADTLKCFDYKSKWTDVSGCIDLKRDSINLQIKNRESLKIVETVVYKRFLGFLWKTNKVKDRQVDVVSENPNTTITNLDYVSIKR